MDVAEMGCTIGAVKKGSRTFLLKNFDYSPTPIGWAEFTMRGALRHFALVDHEQQGVNSGLNEAGLGLVISSSDLPGAYRLEKRTRINARILSTCSSVNQALTLLEEYAYMNRDMRGGNFLFADKRKIAIAEHFLGRIRREVKEEGYIARANHSVLGVVNNFNEGSGRRYRAMESFLKVLYEELDGLSDEEVLERCREVLLSPPILNDNTLGHIVIIIHELSFHYAARNKSWKTFRFTR